MMINTTVFQTETSYLDTNINIGEGTEGINVTDYYSEFLMKKIQFLSLTCVHTITCPLILQFFSILHTIYQLYPTHCFPLPSRSVLNMRQGWAGKLKLGGRYCKKNNFISCFIPKRLQSLNQQGRCRLKNEKILWESKGRFQV